MLCVMKSPDRTPITSYSPLHDFTLDFISFVNLIYIWMSLSAIINIMEIGAFFNDDKTNIKLFLRKEIH